MPADSLHIKQIAFELNEMLGGGRIDKITMPDPDEIVLFVHAKIRRALVLSANPSLPRIHVTKYAPKSNPLKAPAFLMHLRKHIGGAIIKSVNSEDGERIIYFNLIARNELGYEENKTLICEILGKYANIILCDSGGKITESIKHIPPSDSNKRPVLSGITYKLPDKQDKIDVFNAEALKNALSAFEGGKLDGFILSHAAGLAPATISGIVTKTLGGTVFGNLTAEQINSVTNAFDAKNILKNIKPCLRKDPNGKTDFWIAPLFPDGEYTYFDTLNEATDEHFYSLDRDRRLTEKAHVPKNAVKNAIARTEKKLKLFISRKNEAADAEHDRLCGELITANIYRLKQGMKSFTAENYYDNPPSQITIALQENKSPQYNAQAYFKRYSKKKKALTMADEQISKATADLEYFNSVYDSFSFTDEDGLEEIISELYAAGLMHEPKDRRKKEKQTAGSEITYGNCVIRWGKTNLQNDRITKQAKPENLWLHTQKTHGSHVIISGDDISERVILRAAQIAAYYSKARLSDNVPVDYTYKKFVSKPKGSAPGKVIYTDYKTVFVTPKDERE